MSDYEVELKIKGRVGNHWSVIDDYKGLSPENALLILDKKYVGQKSCSKLLKAFDDTWKMASIDVEKFLGIYEDEELSEERIQR